MMGKFAPAKLSNLLSRSPSTRDHPKESEKLQTKMPVATSVASLVDMLAPKQSTQPRLRRLSQFLPKLKTADTKLLKDNEQSLPSKRDQSIYEHNQHVFSPPPARAPPPPPPVSRDVVEQSRRRSSEADIVGQRRGRRDEKDVVEPRNQEEQAANRGNDSWKHGPPSRMAPSPIYSNGRQENNTKTYDNQTSSPYSPAPSPPPQTYSPPLRADSVSPRTLEYRRPRAESLLPLPAQSQQEFNNHSNHRSVSTPLNSRPNSTVYYSDGDTGMETLKQAHRKSSTFLSGLIRHSQTPSQDGFPDGMRAWVVGSGENNFAEYNLGFLMRGDKV